MYIIFKNDCAIFLTDSLENKLKSNFYRWNDFNFETFLKNCDLMNSSSVYLYHADIDFLWDEFKKGFELIDAAGGVVSNENNEILFIYRNDMWDLPKGKVEVNENIEEAAIREVQEECGITELNLGELINKTYHIYNFENQEVLKTTYWYKMECPEKESKMKPQLEENITKVEWKGKDEIDRILLNTYANLRLLISDIT